jgi:phosphoglycerate dehydrogenase-like enzyme
MWTPTPWCEVGRTRWTLVGFGNIGNEIAKRIKPFGAHLTVVRRQRGESGLADTTAGIADLPRVLSETDVVILACSLNAETYHLADNAFFDALKRGSILINVGRGALIDSDALRDGLVQDKPAHAVLDVFETEPLPQQSWMWDHPKVRVSAHTSHFGSGTLERGDDLFLENLRRFIARETLMNEVARADL